jgi:hypothetical protein
MIDDADFKTSLKDWNYCLFGLFNYCFLIANVISVCATWLWWQGLCKDLETMQRRALWQRTKRNGGDHWHGGRALFIGNVPWNAALVWSLHFNADTRQGARWERVVQTIQGSWVQHIRVQTYTRSLIAYRGLSIGQSPIHLILVSSIYPRYIGHENDWCLLIYLGNNSFYAFAINLPGSIYDNPKHVIWYMPLHR